MLQPVQRLSPTGEVIVCPDDDQFGWGESTMKCGYEIVALFWHSVKPGQALPYTSRDVHQMAHSDYVHFAGPDIASDGNGMTDSQLYADLAFHNFHYLKLGLNWAEIRAWLRYGYPVIIGGVSENSVYDLELGGHVPYPWIKPGVNYWHIILATGEDGADSLKFRDTANVDPRGKLRPGPRKYKTSELRFTTATVALPTWLPMPPAGFDPTRPPPAPPPAVPDPKAEAAGLLGQALALLEQAEQLLA